jgi:subtilisin family serine protease
MSIKLIFQIIIINFLIITFQSVSAQNYYYYYNNTKTDLVSRNDGVAIIFKNNNFSETELTGIIKSNLDKGDELKGFEKEYCFIKFGGFPDAAKIEAYKNKFSAKTDLVKFVTPVFFGDSRSVTEFPNDEFVVRLKNLSDKQKLEFLNIRNNTFIKGEIGDEYTYVIKTNENNSSNALELVILYYNTGLFAYVEPNMQYLSDGFFNSWTPNDPLFGQQWALQNTGQTVNTGAYEALGDSIKSSGKYGADMNVAAAWDYTKGNSNVKIAVFDTGIDSLHPDIAANLIVGYNANSNNNTNTIDTGSHGTCTLGLIGARSNNGTGISGICGGDNGSNNCQIASYRLVTNSGAFVASANIARAFDTCRVRNFHVSSNSWGGGTPSSVLDTAMNKCSRLSRGGLGCVILVASGNNGNIPPQTPSYNPNVVCVGASTNVDTKKAFGTGDQSWWGGCYGESASGDLDITAPTICITTDKRGSMGYTTTDYDTTFNGTSCATPNCAGVVGLIFSIDPNFTQAQVKDFLYRGCDKIDNVDYSTTKTYGKWNMYYGYGRVNARNSVRLAAGVDITPPTINHLNINSVTHTYPVYLTAEIFDQDGSSVPTSGTTMPKVFFRKSKNNAAYSSFDSLNALSNAGNVFTFMIPGSGYNTHIQYYIKAYDNSGNYTTFPKWAPDSNYLCFYGAGIITSETQKVPSFTLPTSSGAVSSNVVFSNFRILDANLRIYARHTYTSDFYLMLAGPFDHRYNKKALYSRYGSSVDNITGAYVSDTGSSLWNTGTPPFTNGSFKPDFPLRSLKGFNASGNWYIGYYDAVAGDGGTADSILINLYKTDGTLSPCARHDYASDTIVYFPDAFVTDTLDYYLKNTGNANLTISGYTIGGNYPGNFSILNTPPSTIVPNDSGLFRIRQIGIGSLVKSGNGNYQRQNTDAATENGIITINTNDPSKATFKVSLQEDGALPVVFSAFGYSVSRRTVKLNWTTIYEINNSGFDIERKNSGGSQNDWNKIGFIQSRGNTSDGFNYAFTDEKLNTGKYNYRLKQLDNNGNFTYHNLESDVNVELPSKFALSQNYPNPFNPVTKIDYDLPKDSKVKISVYDASGREISVLVNDNLKAGFYTADFNGSNFASGIYFYRIVSGNFIETKKALLIK